MKYLGSANNAIRGGDYTVAGIVASEAIFRESMDRDGGGLVRATGAFTGQTDATFDVEIVSDSISGAPRVSAPVASGVGNATMTGVAASVGAVAESITVTLADLGTETRSAYTPFQGAELVAKSPGPDANNIEIRISDAGLTRTPTARALIRDLVAGTNEYNGQEWDFGGFPRNPDGTIDTATGRISFGDDPQVYRQFKVFRNGAYVYSFTPAPVRNVSAGARVMAVSGGRTVVVAHTLGESAPAFVASGGYLLGDLVQPTAPNGHWYRVTVGGTAGAEPTWPTDGTTVVTGGVTLIDAGSHTRTYTGITTLYSILSAIQSDPASLIAVADPVVNDNTFGGMGITDLSIETRAFVQSVARAGSANVLAAEVDVVVSPTAPTEELSVRCIAAPRLNAEVWEVRGSVSGLLSSAVTGINYDGLNYDFLIPLLPAPEVLPSSDKSYELQASGGSPKPQACVENFVLGALANAGTFTFVWQLRSALCGCDGADVIGGPNPIFLGIPPGGDTVESLPAELKTRAESLWQWFADFASDNTELGSIIGAIPIETTATDPAQTSYSTLNRTASATLKVDVIDIAATKAARDMFYSTLRAIYDHAPGATPVAAAALWDSAFTDLQADFSPFGGVSGNTGSAFWLDLSHTIATFGGGDTVDNEERMALNRRLFTEQFESYMERYRARMDQVLIAADIEPDFNGPTGGGNLPWVDHNGDGWFVATDSQLLPIQPGFYYHSAVMQTDDDGTQTPVSTQQFGIGLFIGCIDGLKEGDRFIIRIGQTGTSIVGYEVGDVFAAHIVSGSPVQFGGGQIGDDTQTWSVAGSVSGALPDYALNTITPVPYSAANLSWLITPGGIDSRLRDSFQFFVEGGEFRWRKNGGAWSADTQIDSAVVMSDGVSATFDPGSAPSFVPGDSYSFRALAVNGGHHLTSLTYGGIATTEFLEVVYKHRIETVITPASASVCAILFADPTEVGATVIVRGFALAGDAEGTEISTGTALTNGSTALYVQMSDPVSVCAKYTITYYVTVNTPTIIKWLWAFVGHPLELKLPNALPNVGSVSQRWRLPTVAGRRADIGVSVQHTGCSAQSAEDIRYLLERASVDDDGRIAVIGRTSVPAPSMAADPFGAAHTRYPEIGIVVASSEIDFEDAQTFQPVPEKSLLSITLELRAA